MSLFGYLKYEFKIGNRIGNRGIHFYWYETGIYGIKKAPKSLI